MRYLGLRPARQVAVAATLVLAIGVSACGSSTKPSGTSAKSGGTKSSSKSITIAAVPYDDVAASSALASYVLEKAGYTVKTQTLGSVGLAFAATANGNADLDFEAWLPHTHAVYWHTYGAKLVKLGKLYHQHASTGLLVPDYCPGRSISDLNKYASTYGGKIIGTSAGSGEAFEDQKAKSAYGLKLTVVPASEAAQDASIKAAVATHKCAVVALWNPEPTWSEVSVRYLSDPKGIYPPDYAYSVGKKSFPKAFPGPTAFLARFTLPITDQDQMMKRETQGESAAKAVQPWIAAHSATVKKWISLAKG